MQGSRSLAVTQQQAWEALNDPDVLKACIPGCERMERTGDDQYAVGVALRIGPMAARFAGKVQMSEVDAPNGYTLSFDGQGGAAGFGKGSSRVTLVPAGAGCELAYTVQAQVGGKIAQMGQRLIDGVARSMADDFFKRLDEEMQRRHPPVEAVVEVPAAVVEGLPGANGSVPAWAWIAAGVVGLGLLAWLAR